MAVSPDSGGFLNLPDSPPYYKPAVIFKPDPDEDLEDDEVYTIKYQNQQNW
jgi:hypothetical protein